MAGNSVVTLTVLGVSLLCACRAEEAPDPGVAVRDSAGITIVESLEPAWGEGEGWRLSLEPILDIGVVEGDPVYQLDQVRHVVRALDGRIGRDELDVEHVRMYGLTRGPEPTR